MSLVFFRGDFFVGERLVLSRLGLVGKRPCRWLSVVVILEGNGRILTFRFWIYRFEPNNSCNFWLTSSCCFGESSPNSRRINSVVTVIKRCNRMADETRSPVDAKPSLSFWRITSLASGFSDKRLVMNAKTTCLYCPIGSVRQTAGRTLLLERSSKGKGTRTTLFFNFDWFAIIYGVNIFGSIVEKLECRIF